MGIVLKLAWRNLWRHRRRTLLMLGAMVFSNLLLVFMISLQFGMYGLMIENTLKIYSGSMQVQAAGYKDEGRMRQVVPNVAALAEDLRAEAGSAAVAARAVGFALVSSEDRSFGLRIVGVEPEYEPAVASVPGLLAEGRYLEAGERDAIVIGSVTARNLKVGIGDELTLLGSGRDGSIAAAIASVVGIFDSGVTDFDRSIAYLPLQFFQDVYFMDGAGHEIVFAVDDLDEVPALAEEVTGLLPAGQDLVVHDWDALQPGLKQAIQADISSAFFTYAVLVILVAFSVLNTQLMSVLERTREFGIVLALGVSPSRLRSLVLIETVIMALIGMALGMLAGALFTGWFTANGFSYPGMAEMAAEFNLPAKVYPAVNGWSLIIGPVAVFVFAVLAAVYPALRLHWMRPVEAMRAA